MTGECLTVAVVDDDDDLRAALAQVLDLDRLKPLPFPSGEAALAAIGDGFPGIVVTDLRMPGLDGAGLFARLSALDPELPVVIITGHGDLPTAVDLMKRGAYDFIAKPFSAERLLPTVRRALEKRSLVLENRMLREAGRAVGDLGWIGASDASARIRATLRQVADAGRPVLIRGESGTGKSHAAALLHRLSHRARQAVVTVDCGALPLDDPAAHLFGHASGAMPYRALPRSGALRRADRGTLVLDRIDRLPPALQAPLAQVLETGAVTPLGSDTPLPLDTTIVAICDADLNDLADRNHFDRALAHRLSGLTVTLPPLRERPDDVPGLFGAFLSAAAERAGRPVPPVAPTVIARLRTDSWPTNAYGVMALAEETALGLDTDRGAGGARSASLRDAVAAFEAESIRAALAESGGDIEAARAALDLPRKTLYDKLARHGIVPAHFRRR